MAKNSTLIHVSNERCKRIFNRPSLTANGTRNSVPRRNAHEVTTWFEYRCNTLLPKTEYDAQHSAAATISNAPTGSKRFSDVLADPSTVINMTPKKATKTPLVLRDVNGSFRNAAESNIANTAWRLIITDPAVAEISLNE